MQLFQEDGSYILMNEGLDISLSLRPTPDNPTAWYVSEPRFEPVRANGWVGAVAEGGSVNFRDIFFNPHGHGTHTECLGHIFDPRNMTRPFEPHKRSWSPKHLPENQIRG